MTIKNNIHIIYDELCPLCINIKKIISFFDINNSFSWIKSNDNLNITKYFDLEDDSILKETIVVKTKKNTLLTKFRACRYIFSYTSFIWPISILCYIPLISIFLGDKLYLFILSNRKCNPLSNEQSI